MGRVLGVESSCDEMAAAVLDADGKTVLSSVIHSQVDLHARYGGVVPEVASRDHVERVGLVIEEALSRAKLGPDALGGVAVTAGPGLIGSLLCGVEAAKGLALAAQKPLLGVNHLEGHVAAAALEPIAPEPPFVALIVSGGHTSLVEVAAWGGPYRALGSTRDDAAGEAFDKTAKLLGLGYPGGVRIDHGSVGGDIQRFPFPKAMPGKDNLDFSFSGLKTAAARLLEEHGPLDDQGMKDFCASFQHAIVENLLKKAFRATLQSGTRRLVLAGGVAANRRLRERAEERGRRERVQVYLPSKLYCTDNAAMIARAGWVRLSRGERSGLDLGCTPTWPLSRLGAA
ncbi:MAG: tRNA (adenosine(37)-N6)-threonylcarbamoyltransferase complex transferase subunit TsaD [Myxococcota bacterium]